MFQRLQNKQGLLKHKQEHLTMHLLKFGKTKLMISDQTFGLLAVYFMK